MPDAEKAQGWPPFFAKLNGRDRAYNGFIKMEDRMSQTPNEQVSEANRNITAWRFNRVLNAHHQDSVNQQILRRMHLN